MTGDINGHVPPVSIHYEQRRIGHICSILVRNLSLRPTRDRALQTLTCQRPGGSNRNHATSDDADLTLSLSRSHSKGKAKADSSRRRQRSASWSRLADDGSSDEDQQSDVDELEATPTKLHISHTRKTGRGRSALLANHRRTSGHELTTSSSFASASDGAHSVEASPRPILKRASSHRDGRDARMHHGGSPSSTTASNFLDEFGANTTMLSRSDSRSSSHSSHTIRRHSHRARTTSMTSSTSVRSVRFDESHVGASDEARRPSRISGRLSAASRYMPFSQKSLAQIMKDRMLECYAELSLVPHQQEALIGTNKVAADANTYSDTDRVFYRSSVSKPGLHHSWGYQGGDPIIPERDFAIRSEAFNHARPLEASTLNIKIWARAPLADGLKPDDAGGWKLVCQTSTDLRDLEPLPGNAQGASLSLPPNSILLGLAPGANSLSGRASLACSDSHSGLDSKVSGGAKEAPKLPRKVSEREAERTRHILESIIYYVVPLQPARQGSAAKGNVDDMSPKDKWSQGDGNPRRPSNLRRRSSLEGYASDPENAPSRKASSAPSSEQIAAPTSSTSSSAAMPPSIAAAATPEARRRERRRAFEDEQRRVLELSLRETKMMPSYTFDDAKHLTKKQTELHDLLTEVQKLRLGEGDTLQDPEGFVQLRLKREQQKARYEAARQMAIDEADELERKRAELADRRAALEARQAAIHASKSVFGAAEATARRLRDQVQVLNDAKAEIALQLHVQQASLLRDLETIFPIELSDASSLLFSVCGLPLPNAVSSLPPAELAHQERRWKDTIKAQTPASTRPVFHPFDDDTVSSALGLVAQLVVLLSTYLATPIHYPLATAGSRAVVQDSISLMSGPRAFPLYAKGMERYRYEYAAFLLNKDIEQLINVHSVTVIDIRHTLPNLKNLMVTVAAAPPTSKLTRRSHIGKTEIALHSEKAPVEEAGVEGGRKAGLGIGLGLPNLAGTANGATGERGGKKEVVPDALVTTRVLGAPSTAAATPATASGAIASVSRAFSYFSGGSAR